jgi:hypothetical protein
MRGPDHARPPEFRELNKTPGQEQREYIVVRRERRDVVIVVQKVCNPWHYSQAPASDMANPEWLYEVVLTINTLDYRAGDRLTPFQVEGLIGAGVFVTIRS